MVKHWLFSMLLIVVLVVVLYECYLSQYGSVVFRLHL